MIPGMFHVYPPRLFIFLSLEGSSRRVAVGEIGQQSSRLVPHPEIKVRSELSADSCDHGLDYSS